MPGRFIPTQPLRTTRLSLRPTREFPFRGRDLRVSLYVCVHADRQESEELSTLGCASPRCRADLHGGPEIECGMLSAFEPFRLRQWPCPRPAFVADSDAQTPDALDVRAFAFAS